MNTKPFLKRYRAGLLAATAVALVWLVVLPWVADQALIRQHVDALHAADINASAMFYSELECRYLLDR
jgi:hypothetical protein